MLTRAAVLLAVVALAAGSASRLGTMPPTAVPAGCQVHQLPSPPGAVTGPVVGASPDGHTLLGDARTGAFRAFGVLWRDGAVVGTTPSVQGAGELIDVNDRGDVVGNSAQPGGFHPWRYLHGVARMLPGIGSVIALGPDGTMVGSVPVLGPSYGPTYVPARWRPDTDQPELLRPVPDPMPTRDTGEATDIAQDGTVVGYVGIDGYVWYPDGRSQRLPRPPGFPADAIVTALKINGPWVVGKAGNDSVVRWNLAADAVDVLPYLSYLGNAFNHADMAVSASGLVAAAGGYQGVVSGGGRPVPLPSLPSPSSMFSYLNDTTTISADGSVIGGRAVLNANPGSGSPYLPVYWSCAPVTG